MKSSSQLLVEKLTESILESSILKELEETKAKLTRYQEAIQSLDSDRYNVCSSCGDIAAIGDGDPSVHGCDICFKVLRCEYCTEEQILSYLTVNYEGAIYYLCNECAHEEDV